MLRSIDRDVFSGSSPGHPVTGLPGTGEHLSDLITPQQLDEAVDCAARAVRATVATFVASPMNTFPGGQPTTALEIAIEFFVPPDANDVFAHELDVQLLRMSLGYAQGRRRCRLAPPAVRPVPGGTFHQWRMAHRHDDLAQHFDRWSRQRRILDSVLEQARVGWHELAV